MRLSKLFLRSMSAGKHRDGFWFLGTWMQVEEIIELLDLYTLDDIQLFIDDYTISPHLLHNLGEYLQRRTREEV